MSKFSASVAFHGLSLAVSGKMVWSSALVASSRAWSTSKSTTRNKSTTETPTWSTKSTSGSWDRAWAGWAGARALTPVSPNPIYNNRITYSQVSGLSTVIATPASTSSAEAQSWAVSLNMA